MTASQFAPGRDLVLECMNHHYKRGQRHRARVQIKLDQFSNITLVECELKGRLYRDWFVDGVPQFSYWLTYEQRVDIVKHFFQEGFSGIRIADMLMIGKSTIYRDIRRLRDNGELPEGRQEKVKPQIVRHSFKVAQLELVVNAEAKISTNAQLSRVKRAMAAAR